jgi:hypothetical protein
VAVVNSPQLTKGEETGFEFVHKSFSEYLMAEHLAFCIEKIIFKAPEFGSDRLTWRMSDQEAVAELAPIIGIRLITDEILEMLEPMLGCLVPFLKTNRVDKIVYAPNRQEGLNNIIERFEKLYCDHIQGKNLEIINQQTNNKLLITNPLEAYANFCASIILIGTSAIRRLSGEKSKERKRLFNIEPVPGSFWRFLCLLHVGGINFSDNLSRNLFDGLEIMKHDRNDNVGDLTIPIKLNQLSIIKGYESLLGGIIEHLSTSVIKYGLLNFVLRVLSQDRNRIINDKYVWEITHRHSRFFQDIEEMLNMLERAGYIRISEKTVSQMRDYERFLMLPRSGTKIKRFPEPSDNYKQIFYLLNDQRDPDYEFIRLFEDLFGNPDIFDKYFSMGKNVLKNNKKR